MDILELVNKGLGKLYVAHNYGLHMDRVGSDAARMNEYGRPPYDIPKYEYPVEREKKELAEAYANNGNYGYHQRKLYNAQVMLNLFNQIQKKGYSGNIDPASWGITTNDGELVEPGQASAHVIKDGNKYVLLPRRDRSWREIPENLAVQLYKETGQSLGSYDNWEQANKALGLMSEFQRQYLSNALSELSGEYYNPSLRNLVGNN